MSSDISKDEKIIHNPVTGSEYKVRNHSSKYGIKKDLKGLWQDQKKNPLKNIDEKGSRIDDLNTAHMFIPLKLRKACRKLSSCVESVSLHPIKTPAVILSMTGSVLVAMPTTILRIAGFSVWMISNTLWFIQGQKVKDFYLMALFGFYFVTAAIGVYNLT